MIEIVSIITGALLSVISIMAAGNLIAPRTSLPCAVRFSTGAAIFSLIVFLVLAFHAGYWPVYGALPVALVALGAKSAVDRLPRMPAFFRIVLIGFSAFYFVYALAPEIQADAAGYHLRLVSDYVRLHALTPKAGFYDVLPQGMEMLFVPAFAFGAGSAAKLVHFAFLIAAIPLIRELAREAGVSNAGGCAAAAIFFLAPVCAIDGTSAYTDAGLVCACCSVLILMIRWNRERAPVLMVCAAINAGFCYAVKPTFGWVAVVAVVFIAVRERRAKSSPVFGCVVLVCASPWLLRAHSLAGSITAPFLSQWLPNSVLTPDLENHLAAQYSAFRPAFHWSQAWLGYTLTDTNQGVFGPAFLLLPVALIALAKPRLRWLGFSAMLLTIPFLFNTGARFLMPAMAVAAVALMSVLPRRIAFAVVTLQALAATPLVLDGYVHPGGWRLGRPPLAAALRIEPEDTYLRRSIDGFAAAKMAGASTPPGARIFACVSLAEAYIPRELLTWWHSRQAQKFTDSLQFAMMSQGTRARLVSWRWPRNQYQSLRITALSDLRLISANLTANAARPSSWQMHKSGETVNLSAPPGAHGADLLIWPGDQALERTEVLLPSGSWSAPDGVAERSACYIDLRKDATAYIRRSGFDYILIPVAESAFAPIGIDMVRHPEQWGVSIAGEADGVYLLRIREALL